LKASEVSTYVKAISDSYFKALGLNHNQSIKKINGNLKKVFLVSPHPDDEAINGALALRLKLELGYEVFNVPFSLGSNEARKNQRLIELKNACSELGFELTNPLTTGNEKNELRKLIEIHNPSIIITSHQLDGHKTHEKCGETVLQTLIEVNFQGSVVFHEYWFPQKNPNLLLEIPDKNVITMIKALLHHEGEISRNPYHLRLPHTLIENSRRGSEIILGVEKESSDLLFSTIMTKGSIMNKEFVQDSKKSLIRTSDELFFCFGN
jgi:hypothetical protein